MEFDDLLASHLAGLHGPDDPTRIAAEAVIGRVYATADQRVRADWFLDPGSDIGVHLHGVPDDVDGIPWLSTLLEEQRAAGRLHQLDYFALVHVHTGRADFHHEKGSEELNEGDVLFFGPGVLHDVQPHRGAVIVSLILRIDLLDQSVWTSLPYARIFSDYIAAFPCPTALPSRFLFLPAEGQEDPRRAKAMV